MTIEGGTAIVLAYVLVSLGVIIVGGHRNRRKVAALGPARRGVVAPRPRGSAFGVPPKPIYPNAGVLSSHEDWESCARWVPQARRCA